MKPFCLPVQLRWSDLDPNFHLRHSVYYDWGAMCRVAFLESQGLTHEVYERLHVGPILFREECQFRREVRSADVVQIDLALIKAKKDFSRWSIRHHIYKDKATVAAIIVVEGAWIDTKLRKLTTPPPEAQAVFAHMPQEDDFTWMD